MINTSAQNNSRSDYYSGSERINDSATVSLLCFHIHDRQWVDEKLTNNQLSLCIKPTFQLTFATFVFKFF